MHLVQNEVLLFGGFSPITVNAVLQLYNSQPSNARGQAVIIKDVLASGEQN
jgi:hypothetical protein